MVMRRFKFIRVIKHLIGLKKLQIYFNVWFVFWFELITVDQYIKILYPQILLWPLLKFVFNIKPYYLNEMYWN